MIITCDDTQSTILILSSPTMHAGKNFSKFFNSSFSGFSFFMQQLKIIFCHIEIETIKSNDDVPSNNSENKILEKYLKRNIDIITKTL